MDNYSSLHLLLFRMSIIEDLLDRAALKVPDPNDENEEESDDDFMAMDWEETVGPFNWEEPGPGAALPKAPPSLSSIPKSHFHLEVTPPKQDSHPVDTEATKKKAVGDVSPKKDVASPPVHAPQPEEKEKASPQKDSSPQKSPAPLSPLLTFDESATEESSKISPAASTIIDNVDLDLTLGV